MIRLLALLAFVAISLTGCPSSDEGAGADNAAVDDPASEAFEMGDLIEPFDPPPLESLDASADWEDRPVRDGMEVMREWLARQPQPEVTVEQALALKNDSPEDNLKITRALGQLAPPDGEGVDYSASVVRHVSGDLNSTNPLLMSSVTEFEYHDLTSIALVTFDRNFDYFADDAVVESWQTSEDRLADKFVLRDDLFWSDGAPVTAHDFEFTYRVIMTESVTVPALRSSILELQYVKAYDDRTLVIFHKEAMATNTENCIFPAIPKHVYADTIPADPKLSQSAEHSRLEDEPVVAGPYRLQSRKRGKEFVLRRREGYYMVDGEQVRDKPYFRELRVKIIEDPNTALLALKQGDIHSMELRPEQWVFQTGGPDYYRRNTKATDTEWVEFHFNWNTQHPFFKDPRVRWAMTYAMDYDELINTLNFGLYEQSRGNFHHTSWMFPKDDPPDPVKQDLDRAAELLAEAGWEDTDGDGTLDKEFEIDSDGDGEPDDTQRVPFEFTLITYQTDSGINTATLLAESLDLIGVDCRVKPTEFTVLVKKQRDRKFEAAMGGWGTGTDPSTNKNIFGSKGGRNYGGYVNAEVDRLFERGERETDPDRRAEIYGKIHNQLWEDQPYTWLFYRNSFYGFNKKLRGYNFSPRGPFNYSPGFRSVYVPAE